MSVIQLTNASKRYGRIQALDSVTLSVKAGEIFGLLGANGAGKSTLIRLLTGSTRPTSGSITVLGRSPVRDSQAVRREIGYMPQAPALYEDLSPRDNLRFFGHAHQTEGLEERISELLDFSNLRHRERDAVHEFSGGMKQRVSLACALLHRPPVLLLDEPTAGVDPRLRAEFWKHFRELAAAGVTLLISTHQMDEALYCDRLAVLSDGRVIACDTPRNILHQGRAKVRVWRNGNLTEEILEDYPERLPTLLGLDPSVTRIELQEDTLDNVLLGLIQERGGAPRE
ncbi:MAG TPA: ABC transporter ATP-binding protein [Bryobacteraceae bacterium]|nr:ABC transporter ATP-binding protein [Bryobacteraceae bacterium]